MWLFYLFFVMSGEYFGCLFLGGYISVVCLGVCFACLS